MKSKKWIGLWINLTSFRFNLEEITAAAAAIATLLSQNKLKLTVWQSRSSESHRSRKVRENKKHTEQKVSAPGLWGRDRDKVSFRAQEGESDFNRPNKTLNGCKRVKELQSPRPPAAAAGSFIWSGCNWRSSESHDQVPIAPPGTKARLVLLASVSFHPRGHFSIETLSHNPPGCSHALWLTPSLSCFVCDSSLFRLSIRTPPPPE